MASTYFSVTARKIKSIGAGKEVAEANKDLRESKN